MTSPSPFIPEKDKHFPGLVLARVENCCKHDKHAWGTITEDVRNQIAIIVRKQKNTQNEVALRLPKLSYKSLSLGLWGYLTYLEAVSNV